MVKNSKLILLIIILFVGGCANQMAPGGGEVDRIPPTVIESFPKDGTTNYKDQYLEIKFSEYVDRLSVQNAIFISPALEKGFDYGWTGKSLTIEIKDTLLENTTYTVTIGTDVVDLNNRNKMAEPYSFVFSTGNKIDKGKISGTVRTERVNDVMIFAYQSDDEIDPGKLKPNYISQIGEKGSYSLVGLRDGNYKIFAVRDNLKDLLYQPNEEDYGTQSKKIVLQIPQIVEVNNIDFFLSKEDTVAPKLNSAFMTDRNHLVVEFNEGVDSTLLSANNFSLIDTTTNKQYKPDYFIKADLKRNQFCIIIKDTSSFANCQLLLKDFKDLKGNVTEQDRIPFIYKNVKDTTLNKITRLSGNNFENKVEYDEPLLNVQFFDAIDSTEVMNRISIEDERKNRIPFTFKKTDDALFQLHISQKLKQGAEYILLLDMKNYIGNSKKTIDTVYKHKFAATSELDFSGVSGTVTSADQIQKYVVVESISSPKTVYKQKVDSKNKFDFKKIIPGKYIAWAFKDRNNNSKYDFGKIKPFTFSEEFKFLPDTLNLRARWPVGDVNISFDK